MVKNVQKGHFRAKRVILGPKGKKGHFESFPVIMGHMPKVPKYTQICLNMPKYAKRITYLLTDGIQLDINRYGMLLTMLQKSLCLKDTLFERTMYG